MCSIQLYNNIFMQILIKKCQVIYIVQFLQGDHSTLVLFLGKRRICNNQLSVKIFDYDLILLKVEG